MFSLWVLKDGICSRTEASVLLGAFLVILPLYCWYNQKTKAAKRDLLRGAPGGADAPPRLWASFAKLLVGLGLLVGSSHILVWGAVDFAKFCGVSDLVIGLTIVAAGTSLPELASAVASARRGEHEFILGNIIGSNLFNTLAVVGLATVIAPLTPGPGGEPAYSRYILTRDLPLMVALSLSILVFGVNWRRPKSPHVIRRGAAWTWLLVFVGYTLLMFVQETR